MKTFENSDNPFPEIKDDAFGRSGVSSCDERDPFMPTNVFAPSTEVELKTSEASTPSLPQFSSNPFETEAFHRNVVEPIVTRIESKSEFAKTSPSFDQPGNDAAIDWPDSNTTDSRDLNSAEQPTSDEYTTNLALSSSSGSGIASSYSELDSSEPSSSSHETNCDSGNVTAGEINENVQINVYTLMQSKERKHQIPQVIFTEATITSEESSSCDANSNQGLDVNDGGETRLLDSSATDVSEQNCSEANIVSLDCSEQLDYNNLSSMNISMIVSEDTGVPQEDEHIMAPTQTHSVFPGTCLDANSSSEVTADVKLENAGVKELNRALDVLVKPKTCNRMLTSSPICSREFPKVDESLTVPMQRWQIEFHERIELHDEQEKKDIEKLKLEARNELNKWYEERHLKIEAHHKLQMENQDSLQSIEEEQKQNVPIWERMAGLALELQRNNKNNERKKDVSRMKHLLHLLKVKSPTPPVNVALL